MEEKTVDKGAALKFACMQCGGDLQYAPGTKSLKCTYCGAVNEIPVIDTKIEELDFNSFLQNAEKKEQQMTVQAVKCNSCGATSTLDPNIKSAFCPYCSSPLIVSDAHSESFIQPQSLLPFKLDQNQATTEFRKWIKKLWFAPGALKKAALSIDRFKGIYVPFWTYDSQTNSQYIGQRGVHYYVTETYQTTNSEGKSVTETREVQKTRWYSASGAVSKFFDDILIPATGSLPLKYLNELEPWDLENLVAFDVKFLSGYVTEKYTVDLAQGFENAKPVMDDEIRNLVRQDIGGDEQRILTLNTQFSNITFKHLLLPVYLSVYSFKNKLYRFMVNARTGEVKGERPWSVGKIVLLVLAILAVIGIIILIANQSK